MQILFLYQSFPRQGVPRFEMLLRSVLFNFQISREDIEKYSNMLKILKIDYQDNEDTVFYIKVSPEQGSRFKQSLQSLYNSL